MIIVKVKEGKIGYYGHRRRREGDIFRIKSEKEFSKNWMEVVEGAKLKEAKEVVEVEEAKDAKALEDKDVARNLTEDEIEVETEKKVLSTKQKAGRPKTKSGF